VARKVIIFLQNPYLGKASWIAGGARGLPRAPPPPRQPSPAEPGQVLSIQSLPGQASQHVAVPCQPHPAGPSQLCGTVSPLPTPHRAVPFPATSSPASHTSPIQAMHRITKPDHAGLAVHHHSRPNLDRRRLAGRDKPFRATSYVTNPSRPHLTSPLHSMPIQPLRATPLPS
jgi:hypothetical protein